MSVSEVSLLPVAIGGDEVQAAVDSVVLGVLAVKTDFIQAVLLKLMVNVVGQHCPASHRT